MDNAEKSVLHVSQNIPTKSDLKVSMKRPLNVQVHVSAVGPRHSSLTWQLDGNPEKNEIDVEQKTPDQNSKLSCHPECSSTPSRAGKLKTRTQNSKGARVKSFNGRRSIKSKASRRLLKNISARRG